MSESPPAAYFPPGASTDSLGSSPGSSPGSSLGGSLGGSRTELRADFRTGPLAESLADFLADVRADPAWQRHCDRLADLVPGTGIGPAEGDTYPG